MEQNSQHKHLWWRCAYIPGECAANPEDHDFCGCGVERPHVDGQPMEEE